VVALTKSSLADKDRSNGSGHMREPVDRIETQVQNLAVVLKHRCGLASDIDMTGCIKGKFIGK
jgi:hypothetical protein